MELRHLEHFVAVAEEGHFTRAANHCHLSQSALSASIRSLERELGSPLFVRTTRKVELTAAGRVLLGEAKRTLAAASSARESVLAVQGLLRGSLGVGGPALPGLVDQAALLARFHELHPAVDIRYMRDSSTALIAEVAASRLDIALVTLPSQLSEPVLAIPLVTQPIMLICRSDHPLADQQSVTIESLAEQDFVGLPPGTIGYEAVDRIFAGIGKRPRVPFQVYYDMPTQLDFVGHGLGVTLAAEWVAASRPDLRAIPLGSTMTWTLAVIVPRQHATPAARVFLALLREEFRNSGDP